MEQVLRELRDDVVVLKLHRPQRMNALTGQMSAELTAVIEDANADDEVGAIVITGSGRGFCAGADIEDAFTSQLSGETSMPHWQEWTHLVRSSKPLVAAVNGVAFGVGLSMILPFDRIVAAHSARFSVRFVKMGLVPELASTYFLPQRVGFGVASDLMLSGRTVDATEAFALGLADELVADDALLDAAVARARSYGENPRRQLGWIKQLLTTNASDPDIIGVQQREMALLLQCFESPEHREAVTAFREKRAPRFR